MHIHWNATLVDEALNVTENAQDFVLQQYTDLVNQYHGTHRPKEYYDIVAGDWIFKYLHTLYAALQNIKDKIIPETNRQ